MNTRKLLIAVAILTILLVYREQLASLLDIISDQQAVSAYLKGYGSLGPIVLFLLMVAQVFVAVIPGHALMVTAGYVYGRLGLFIVILSTVIGSQIAFTVARQYGRGLIDRLASPAIIERWNKTAQHQGVIFYFFAFVLPIFPSDLMCYVAGLAAISPKRFLLANILGRTCCAVFVSLIGIYGMHPPVEFWIVSILAMVSVFAGWAIYKRSARVVVAAWEEPCPQPTNR
jgi:uncharacterized membrane protein YdjX (TVP38/TMEM64 family)